MHPERPGNGVIKEQGVLVASKSSETSTILVADSIFNDNAASR